MFKMLLSTSGKEHFKHIGGESMRKKNTTVIIVNN